MMEHSDFIQNLGHLALGSRLKRLSDRIMAAGVDVYRTAGVDFEPRWFPLYRLLAESGPMAVGEAAASLGLTHAAISQTARMMIKRGFLSSNKDPEDERRRVLALTPRALEELPKLRPLWDDIERAVDELVEFSGIDILACVDGIEHALAREPLVERCTRLRLERQLMEVEIVEYAPEYAGDFRRLNVEWLEKHFSVEPIDERIFANPKQILDDGGSIIFAKLGDEVVGTCALFRSSDGYEVAKMGVTERHRGKHIGKLLLSEIIERAKALGAESVFLVTNSSLLPATSLYRSFGFRVTHSGPHPTYARGDLTMELSL